MKATGIVRRIDPSVIIGAKIIRPEHTDPSLILSSFTISDSRPSKTASLMPQRNSSPKNPLVGADAFRKYLPAIPGGISIDKKVRPR